MSHLPYEEITVKMICDKAGVSRMSFYRYYSTKEDIFINYSDERFADFYENCIQGKTITPHTFCEDTISYLGRYRDQIRAINRSHLLYIFVGQFEKYISYIMSQTTNDIQLRFKENPLLVPYFAGGLANTLSYWCKHDFVESEDEIAHRLKEILTQTTFPRDNDK